MAKENVAKLDLVPGSPSEPPAVPPGKLESGAREAIRPRPQHWLAALILGAGLAGAAVGAIVQYEYFFLDGPGVKRCTEADVNTSCGNGKKWCGPPTICRCLSEC